MALTAKQFIEGIYVAYFGRAGDPAGVGYWLNLYNQGQFDFAGIAENFAQQEEATDAYAYFNAYFNYPGYEISDSMREAFVTEVYQNLFNRAPDADGLAYWLDVLESGASSPGAFIAQIINAAYEGREGASADDWNNLWAKIQVAEYYTDQVVETGADWSAAENLDDAQAAIAGITASSDLEAAFDAVDSLISGTVNVGQTFTLTTGADALTGTPNNDTFVATETTLSSADVLDGGAGTDTLRYASSGNAAVNEAGFEAKSIEVVQVTSDATGGTAFDVTGVTGLQTLRNFNSSEDLTLTGMKNLAAVELVSVGSAGALANDPTPDTTLVFDAAVVAGKADALNVKLDGNLNVDGSAIGDLTANGVEAFHVTTAGSATQMGAIISNTLNAITVEGDQDLTFTTPLTFAADGSIDAHSFKGNLRVAVNSGAVDVTVTGGTGNDTVDFSNGFDKGDSFDGGEGEDTIVLTNAVATGTPAGSVSNVEALNVSTAGTGTIDMDNFSGVKTVNYTAGIAAGAMATVADAVSGITAETSTVNNGSLTVALKTNGADDTVNLKLDVTSPADALATVTADQAETLNLTATDTTANGNGAVTLANLSATQAKALNIAGNADLTIANVNDPATPVLASINAAQATGNLTISGINTAASGATIVLGKGDDVFNVATSDGADTITLGDGADRIVYTAVAQSDRDMDTITDFVSGTDIVDARALMGGVGVASSTQFVGNHASFGLAQGALSGKTADAVFQQDDHILWVDSFTDGTLDNRDFRVKLDGVSSITAADLGFGVGNTITLTAPAAVVDLTTKINADNVSTVEDDTFISTVANLAGSKLDGKGGADVLNITDDLAGANLAATTVVASIETVNLLGGASVASTMFNGATKVVSFAATNLTLGTGGQTYVGGDWVDTITDNVGNDTITTGGGADVITLTGGNDSVDAGSGNDTINVNATLTVADTIIGGAGTDTLNITDGTAATDLNNVTGIETINITNTNASAYTTVDQLVDAGATLTVNIAAGSAGAVTFNGAAETDGSFVFADGGSAKNHVLTGGAGNDVFKMALNTGAAVSLTGGDGDDSFDMGANLTVADTIAGGLGNDTLTFKGTTAATDLDGVSGVETIFYTGGAITTAVQPVDTVIAAGTTVTFDATGAAGAANFDFSNETDGSLIYKASANGDTVKVAANQLSDTYILGAGADKVDITTGNNTIANIANVDTIQGFTAGTDKIDATTAGAGVFSVTIASTNAANFLGDLNTELSKNVHWSGTADAVGDVILVTVNSGAMAGTYLVSDDITGDGMVTGTAEVVKMVGIVGTITAADVI